MSKTSTWMPLFIGDYRGDTSRLTTEQHGAYLLLIMDYWRNGPPPDDDEILSTLTLLPMDRWMRHRSILSAFFQVGDGIWRHKRIDRELRTAAGNAERFTERAKNAAEKRWGSRIKQEHDACSMLQASPEHATSIAQGMLEECPPPPPSKVPEAKKLQDAAASMIVDKGQSETREIPSDLTPAQVLYSRGLEILTALVPSSTDAKVVRSSLAKFEKAAGPEIVMGILRDCEKAPPKGSVYAWVMSECKKLAKSSDRLPRLVIDNGDPRGIQTWSRGIPGVKPTVGDAERRDGNWVVYGWVIDWVAERVAEAAELPLTCQFDWSLLSDWLAQGMEPDSIIKQIERALIWLRKQPGGYTPPSSLKLFDTFVRGARKVA
jgi:uncharacterized protein YdaU (DUF1376 family)